MSDSLFAFYKNHLKNRFCRQQLCQNASVNIIMYVTIFIIWILWIWFWEIEFQFCNINSQFCKVNFWFIHFIFDSANLNFELSTCATFGIPYSKPMVHLTTIRVLTQWLLCCWRSFYCGLVWHMSYNWQVAATKLSPRTQDMCLFQAWHKVRTSLNYWMRALQLAMISWTLFRQFRPAADAVAGI